MSEYKIEFPVLFPPEYYIYENIRLNQCKHLFLFTVRRPCVVHEMFR